VVDHTHISCCTRCDIMTLIIRYCSYLNVCSNREECATCILRRYPVRSFSSTPSPMEGITSLQFIWNVLNLERSWGPYNACVQTMWSISWKQLTIDTALLAKVQRYTIWATQSKLNPIEHFQSILNNCRIGFQIIRKMLRHREVVKVATSPKNHRLRCISTKNASAEQPIEDFFEFDCTTSIRMRMCSKPKAANWGTCTRSQSCMSLQHCHGRQGRLRCYKNEKLDCTARVWPMMMFAM
jgi:hypothetical protein